MYEIWKDGERLFMTEHLNYIRHHADGFYYLCPEEDANGVAVKGIPYHLEGKEELPGCETVLVQEIDAGKYSLDVVEFTAGGGVQSAEQLRRAIQLFAAGLPEEQALEIATVYPAWEINKSYVIGDIISYGVNSVGDPQLYKVVQAHISQADWAPDSVPALYDAFGLDDSGYPIWSQPSGAHDAYNTGDIVNYNGTLYESVIDGNVWSPDVYPAGWEVYTV